MDVLIQIYHELNHSLADTRLHSLLLHRLLHSLHKGLDGISAP